MTRSAATLVACLLLVLGLPFAPRAAAQTPEPTEVDVPSEPVDLGVYGGPVRFEAAPGTTLTLGSGRRLVDTVEVRPNPRGDGLVVIGDMTTQTYVEGIAEMPARWPIEALKAQAVAARTYAWYQITLGTFEERGLGYDICATTACQVYRGREVVETPEVGQRWAQAVAETDGEVLLFDDQPILARYFSTSGGQTRDNEDVFASEGPFPYLKGFEDPFDEVSPLHEWEAVFTREQFDTLLSRGETLAATVPVASVTVEQRDGGQPDLVTVTGQDGTSATVTAGELKTFLNTVAPDQYPDQYPGPRSDGGNLPTTLPSSRYTVEVGEDRVVVDGSGWGHGVGLGQYGAKGRAEQGQTYTEILSTYYNGLEPTTTPALPERVRVGLDDDVSSLELAADGPMRVVAGDTVLAEEAVGSWRIDDGGSDTARLVAPAGYGSPLVVSGTEVSRGTPFTIEPLQVAAVVNKTARARVDVTRPDGTEVTTVDLGVVDAGRVGTVLDLDALGVGTGALDLRVVAVDEAGDEAGGGTSVDVIEADLGGRPDSLLGALAAPSAAPAGDGPSLPLLALGGLLGGLAGLLAAAATSRATDDDGHAAT